MEEEKSPVIQFSGRQRAFLKNMSCDQRESREGETRAISDWDMKYYCADLLLSCVFIKKAFIVLGH
jgi:hypothetical protein